MVQLSKLEIEGFGKFDKKTTIEFKEGVNFINGLNEAGKSTILEAILASLFKYTNTRIEPFFCWTNDDVCKLTLTYKTDKGETFQIISDYKNAKKKLLKVTKSGKTEISTTFSTINQYIKDHFGFDEQKVFENTTFIRQSQMMILGDAMTKNKVRDMVEEVLVGSAEASATKALKKIKKVAKDSKKEADALNNHLEEIGEELREAEENKTNLSSESKEHEKINKELKSKTDKLTTLKENKKLFDEKETLLKEQVGVDEGIEQVDDVLQTLEEQGGEPPTEKKSKTGPIVLITFGVILCLTLYGAILGIPLLILGIYLLVKKPASTPKGEIHETGSKIEKFKRQKRDLIDKKAVLESKLEKYKLVNFTLDEFRELETMEKEVDDLKSKNIELRTSITTTKKLVKSPEESREEFDTIDSQIKELREKAEEHEIAATFLEEAEKNVQQKFTPAIEKNSKSILMKATNKKYSNIKIDEDDLSIAVKEPELNDFVSVESLSQGAKDQVYFSIRTTMTDLLSGNINIPLIFDDPFHNFDDNRLKSTIEAVKELSKKKQIILISHRCYQREHKGFADNVIEV